jgi:PRTRC genetic system protein B
MGGGSQSVRTSCPYSVKKSVRPGLRGRIGGHQRIPQPFCARSKRALVLRILILARGLGRVLWWSPPKKRSLFFKASTHNAGTFDGRGVCPCPGLVFLNDGRSLYVFAYEGDQTPSATTRLCQAPFFNVWSSGQVCVGNARAPKDEQQGDVDAWERMFFGSHFTHPNFTEADRLTHGVNPTTFWKEMLEQERDHFPSDVLVKLNLCVKDLLECSALSALHERPRARGEF